MSVVPLCLSPFSLQPELQQRLERCGWRLRPLSSWTDPLPVGAVLLYDAPDRLLACGDLYPEDLLSGYRQLLELSVSVRQVSAWRLAACSDAALRAGLESSPPEQPWPVPDPLAAVITKLAIDSLPGLLDAYLDLELRSDLLGGEPDAHYRNRLLLDVSVEEILSGWRSQLALASELAEVRAEAELTLLQLHQVQEELEHYFLLSKRQKQLVAGHQQLASALLLRAVNG